VNNDEQAQGLVRLTNRRNWEALRLPYNASDQLRLTRALKIAGLENRRKIRNQGNSQPNLVKLHKSTITARIGCEQQTGTLPSDGLVPEKQRFFSLSTSMKTSEKPV